MWFDEIVDCKILIMKIIIADVIEKLNVLRGRGMALMYSWSCKRLLHLIYHFLFFIFLYMVEKVLMIEGLGILLCLVMQELQKWVCLA